MPKNRKIAIIAVILALITAIFIQLLPKERQITDLERISLNKYSDNVMSYMEEIDITAKSDEEKLKEDGKLDNISLDRYIAYALEYSYGEDNKTSLSVKEIKKIIKKIFDIDLNTEKLNTIGITPLLLDKHVDHDIVSKVYSIRKDGFNSRDIAAIPVAKYIQKSIKADKNDYIITYDKYYIKNPHDAVGHASGNTSNVSEYLEGKGHVSAIKNIINESNADSIGSVEKETTIRVTVKDDKLIITSIH